MNSCLDAIYVKKIDICLYRSQKINCNDWNIVAL